MKTPEFCPFAAVSRPWQPDLTAYLTLTRKALDTISSMSRGKCRKFYFDEGKVHGMILVVPLVKIRHGEPCRADLAAELPFHEDF